MGTTWDADGKAIQDYSIIHWVYHRVAKGPTKKLEQQDELAFYQ